MIGATSLTMGMIHLLIWFQRRAKIEYLIFSLVAFLVAVMSVMELLAMGEDSALAYGGLLRWGHLLFAVTTVLLIVFVDIRFRAGSRWLFHGAWSLRVAALIPNFFTGVNLNFTRIDSLASVEVLGGTISMPIGQANSWMVLGQVATVFLLAYMVSVILHTRRNGDPVQARSALIVCGSVIAFQMTSNLVIVLVVLGLTAAPIMVSLTFLAVVLAASYELGGEVIRAGLLSRKLDDSQRRLGESEDRVQLAAQAGGLGLWTWDIDGDGSWFSPTGYELLQLGPGDTIEWEGLIAKAHPDDRQGLRTARTRALESGVLACEYRLQQCDGPERWLAVAGRADGGSDHLSRVLRGVLVDITERKLAERQREELAHLSRVAVVTEMTSTLAHELSQPLTMILSSAQAAERLLADDPPDLPEVRDCLADIIDSDRRASDVIRRVRTMLRKEPGSHAPMDINEVIQDALHLIAWDLQKRDVAFALQPASTLPPVMGDPVQIKQVLLNLMINAADALEKRPEGRKLTLGSRQVSDTRVEITVSDNGDGIPPDQLEHVFTAFVTSKPSGLGLGLAICRTIAEAHGGMLHASSGSGGGASFHLVLPVAGRGCKEGTATEWQA